MTIVKPSLALLRSLSDEAVLRALMDSPRLTRAELAVATGLSKPTAAEAIRRLEEAGLVHDTGERTSGRGGVGTYYALSDNVGLALAVSVAPDGIVAETVSASGAVRHRVVEPLLRPATPQSVTRRLKKAAQEALQGLDAESVRVAVVAAADPVDRATGALVQLPDAPFLLGAMSPAAALQPVVSGPVLVDNDVNWAARAEREVRQREYGTELNDFVYLHLGEGLGCAVVTDSEVRRGHRGLAGEIAHVLVPGPSGRPVSFITVFAQLGLRHAGSTAIDVATVRDQLAAPGGRQLARTLAVAICGVLTAATALCDPQIVVIGGPWGTADRMIEAIQRAFAQQPRTVPIQPALAADEPSLAGARASAIAKLRTDIISRSAT
jgi:predicted NBD/HSP70 family sugar kinase